MRRRWGPSRPPQRGGGGTHLLVGDEDAPRLGEVVEARRDRSRDVRRVAVVLAPEDRDEDAAADEKDERRVEGRDEAERRRESARKEARDDGDEAGAEGLRGVGGQGGPVRGTAVRPPRPRRTIPENVLLSQSSENERARCSWIIHVSNAEKRMDVATPPRRRPSSRMAKELKCFVMHEAP